MPRAQLKTAFAFLALLGTLLALAPLAAATDPEQLEGKLAGAREEAGALAAELQSSRAALSGSEAEAAAASARESELTGLLAAGQARTARLGERVEQTRRRLGAEKERLDRARAALAARLVAIYESGATDTAAVILAAGDYDDLLTRSHYLDLIAESDRDLADRVEAVRDQVAADVVRVRELRREAVEHEAELASARLEYIQVDIWSCIF